MTGERCTALLWDRDRCRLPADHGPGHVWDLLTPDDDTAGDEGEEE